MRFDLKKRTPSFWIGVGIVVAALLVISAGVVSAQEVTEATHAPWSVILWELVQESWWALVISAAATYLLFALYGYVKPVQRVVLPSEDENRDGLAITAWYFKYILKRLRAEGPTEEQKVDLGLSEATLMFLAVTFLGSCIRGAARIIAAAIVFWAIFAGIAPLM